MLKTQRILAALSLLVALLVGAFSLAPVRVLADNFYAGFVRDSSNYLDVNCKAGCTGAVTPTQAAPSYSRLEDGASTVLGTIFGSGPTDTLTINNPLSTVGFEYAYDDASNNWNRLRAYPSGQTPQVATAGVLNVQGATGGIPFPIGGTKTVSLAPATNNSLFGARAGVLVQFTVTTAGTASLVCYDNSSAASGTILGITPATTTVGQVFTFNNPAATGVYCADPTGGPVATVSYD